MIWRVLFPSSGLWFNIKMTSYQYRKSHCGDKTILRPSYLHNGISYTGKTTSLYWIGALMAYFRKESPVVESLPTLIPQVTFTHRCPFLINVLTVSHGLFDIINPLSGRTWNSWTTYLCNVEPLCNVLSHKNLICVIVIVIVIVVVICVTRWLVNRFSLPVPSGIIND